jgi:hypothetical protein
MNHWWFRANVDEILFIASGCSILFRRSIPEEEILLQIFFLKYCNHALLAFEIDVCLLIQLQYIVLSLSFKWHLPEYQYVKHDSQREDIYLAIVSLRFENFRGNIAWSSTFFIHLV